MPSNVSPERKKYVEIYGAEVVWTNPADGSDGAIRKARELVDAEPGSVLLRRPVLERAELEGALLRTMANEIWKQTEGQVTHFVAGLGTSGTFMGTTRRLRELNPKIRCISMQPDSPFNGLEGLKHMATAIVPAIYDPTLADENIEMGTERAYAMAKRLARTEGLLVGVSAAAAVAASLEVAERGGEGWARGGDCDGAVRFGGEVYERTLLDGGLMLRLSFDDYAALRAHGEETYPEECCGILLGKADEAGNEVRAVMRAGNTRTDSAHNRYHISPLELIQAQRVGRESGLDIVGFYHSHPDHPARWSPTDFAEAHWMRMLLCDYGGRAGHGGGDELVSAPGRERGREEFCRRGDRDQCCRRDDGEVAGVLEMEGEKA